MKIFEGSMIVTSPMRSELTRTSKCRTRQNKWPLVTNCLHCTIKLNTLTSTWKNYKKNIRTYLILVIQSNHTCYVDYNVVISTVEQMDIKCLKLDFLQAHLIIWIYMILSSIQRNESTYEEWMVDDQRE